MEYCYDIADGRDPQTLKWGETGPKLLTDAVLSLNLEGFILAPEVTAMINWWEVNQMVTLDYSDIANDDMYALHLYSEAWRRNGLDKNNRYPQDCIYEKLFELYR